MLVGGGGAESSTAAVAQSPQSRPTAAPTPSLRADDDNFEPSDVVRLGEDGWKQLVRAYVEGLSWVMAYYYQGKFALLIFLSNQFVASDL